MAYVLITADLSFEYMDIKTSRKRPCTPSFLSLSNSFCRGIQSKAFLKSTKHEKSKFRCFCGLDFTYLSISIFNVKMLSIQASRVSRFRFLGNALWDRRSRKVSTNSRISAITEYSFQLRISLPPIYAVFFLWNTSVTPFILVSNSMNW